MISRVLAIVCAGAAALTLGGCFMVQENTFGEALDETKSGAEITTRLLAAGGTSRFGEVDVEVADRFVLLSGRVPSEADKAEAERIAWGVSSVDEVANELVVKGFDFGDALQDTWINTEVRARLIADSDITGVNYNIRVYDGVVYLLGFARSEDELRQAAEHASKVGGVKKVVSYVKMRERGAPPVQTAAAGGAPAEGAISIAPSADAAPIVPPEKPPTTRAQYGDPYAPGAAPPPGSSNAGSNNAGAGLESAPIPLTPQ
jgi:osmotically-inducible protein OsmY